MKLPANTDFLGCNELHANDPVWSLVHTRTIRASSWSPWFRRSALRVAATRAAARVRPSARRALRGKRQFGRYRGQADVAGESDDLLLQPLGVGVSPDSCACHGVAPGRQVTDLNESTAACYLAQPIHARSALPTRHHTPAVSRTRPGLQLPRDRRARAQPVALDRTARAPRPHHARRTHLRRRLLALPGRLTTHAGRWTLHLPARWPWQRDFTEALGRIRALPASA